ncbi:hypothetical protein QBC44DRAFT_308633 [Cladorrhinum sp. PSN332]|nr:hypothetical protein QBC44DRAFT_308633 [Cladorrhinum sp. PSN332]
MFSMRRALLALVLIFVHLGCADPNEFDTPPHRGPNKDYSDNPIYFLGDDLQVEWQTTFTYSTLELWQDNQLGDVQGGLRAKIFKRETSRPTQLPPPASSLITLATSSTSTTAINTPSSEVISSPSPSPDQTGTSVTPGQAAGAAIGGILGLAFLVGGAYILWRRRKISSSANQAELESDSLPPKKATIEPELHEVHGNPINEVFGYPVFELDQGPARRT